MTGRRASVGAILALAAIVFGATAPATLARLTDLDASSQSFSTDTLSPPTNLAATGGASAALTWTPTVDTYATGYEVWRSTTSGSGYAMVGTVTPGTASSGTDSPAAGTFYYVLRAYFQNWRSVNSNQASASIGLATTGYRTCAPLSNAADTGGDNNGYELLALNACIDDLLVATDANTGTNFNTSCTNAGKDRHRFWDFNLGVPAVVTAVDGIQVRINSGMNNNGGTNNVCVQLSWDGGTSWTAAKSFDMSTSAITTYTLGSANDTWGRTWTGANLSNASFRVRIIDASSQPNKNYLLEYLAVQVTYRP